MKKWCKILCLFLSGNGIAMEWRAYERLPDAIVEEIRESLKDPEKLKEGLMDSPLFLPLRSN